MAEHNYKVIREHYGDKMYGPGDERTAAPADVAHLVPHVLEDLGPVKETAPPAEKAEPKAKNKAEPAPKNKDEGQ